MPYRGGSYCLESQGGSMLYGGGSFPYCGGSWRPGLPSLDQQKLHDLVWINFVQICIKYKRVKV